MADRKPSRLANAMLETADDLRRVGVMDAATHEKITLRHLGDTAGPVAAPITGDEIRRPPEYPRHHHRPQGRNQIP